MKGALTLKPREQLKEGEFLTGYNTEVYIGDQPLHGVAQVDIAYRPDNIVIATVVMYTVDEKITGAEPRIMMVHPMTGDWSRVRKIVFDDGSEVDFEDA